MTSRTPTQATTGAFLRSPTGSRYRRAAPAPPGWDVGPVQWFELANPPAFSGDTPAPSDHGVPTEYCGGGTPSSPWPGPVPAGSLITYDTAAHPTVPTIAGTAIAYLGTDLPPATLPPLYLSNSGATPGVECVAEGDAVPADYPVVAWRNLQTNLRVRSGSVASLPGLAQLTYETWDDPDSPGNAIITPGYFVVGAPAAASATPIPDGSISLADLAAGGYLVRNLSVTAGEAVFFWMAPNPDFEVESAAESPALASPYSSRIKWTLKADPAITTGVYDVTVWCANHVSGWVSQTFQLTVTP